MRFAWLFLPFAGLVALSGFVGFRYGQTAQMSETAAVNYWAGHYVNAAGASADITDCAARPHPSDQVWLIISCAQPDMRGSAVVYPIGRDGQLLLQQLDQPLGPEA